MLSPRSREVHALIIEDDYFIVDAIEVTLRSLGYTSIADASNVREAVVAAESRCPDLLVAKHQLMNGTGTDAVLAICKGKEIAVVFVTATPSDVRERLPYALVVAKPFSGQNLSDAVAEARRNPFICN